MDVSHSSRTKARDHFDFIELGTQRAKRFLFFFQQAVDQIRCGMNYICSQATFSNRQVNPQVASCETESKIKKIILKLLQTAIPKTIWAKLNELKLHLMFSFHPTYCDEASLLEELVRLAENDQWDNLKTLWRFIPEENVRKIMREIIAHMEVREEEEGGLLNYVIGLIQQKEWGSLRVLCEFLSINIKNKVKNIIEERGTVFLTQHEKLDEIFGIASSTRGAP